jgi:hypothetical protein
MDRITAMTIQGWPDVDKVTEDGLFKAFAQNEDGKWAAFVYLCKRGDIHMLLISSKPVFDTEEAARTSICELLTEVRSLDLHADARTASTEGCQNKTTPCCVP